MAVRQPQAVIVDTGYWYALFDPRDPLSADARVKAHHIEALTVVVPWPTVYETLGTRFVKNRLAMDAFERALKQPNVEFIDDVPYRDDALEATFQAGRLGRRPMSLCDMLIRLLIQDINVRVDALLTFNIRDFADACRTRRVQIL